MAFRSQAAPGHLLGQLAQLPVYAMALNPCQHQGVCSRYWHCSRQLASKGLLQALRFQQLSLVRVLPAPAAATVLAPPLEPMLARGMSSAFLMQNVRRMSSRVDGSALLGQSVWSAPHRGSSSLTASPPSSSGMQQRQPKCPMLCNQRPSQQ